jgi:hypothetical protein
MKRVVLLVSVALVMVAMMMVMAMSAFAKFNQTLASRRRTTSPRRPTRTTMGSRRSAFVRSSNVR